MSEPQTERGVEWWAVAIVAATVAAGYANALSGEFVYDDRGSIVHNAAVHWRTLDLESLRAAWLESTTRRIVANGSFGLTWYFAQDDPRPYHATNIAVHLLASLCVLSLARTLLRQIAIPVAPDAAGRPLGRPAGRAARKSAARSSGRPGRVGRAESSAPRAGAAAVTALAPLAAALFFAANPVQTQAVSYVVQRMASMAGMFCLLSLVLFIRGRDSEGERRIAWWAGALISWLLAVGSKESAASFPAIIWCYEWLFRRDGDARWALRSLAWVAVAALPMLGLMSFNYPDPLRDYMFHDFGIGERLLSQPRVWLYYATLIAAPLPSRLVLMHEFAPSRGLLEPWTTLPALAAVGGVACLLIGRRKQWPLVCFGFAFFAIAIAIESSVFPLRLVHEHRLYLPLAGIAFALAQPVAALAERAPRSTAIAVALVALLLVAGTHLRNRVWQDRESLWSDVTAKSPGVAMAHVNLGAVYSEAGDNDRGLPHFLRARQLDPEFGGAYRALGTVELHAGRTAEAIPLLLRAVELDPLDQFGFGQLAIALYTSGRAEESLLYFRESLRIFPIDQIVNHYGKALFQLGRLDEALAQHRRALEMNPDYAYAELGLGVTRAAKGETGAARRAFERALEIEEIADAYVEIANLEWSQGAAAAAIAALRRALAIDGEAFVAENNLAWMLATAADASLRNGAEALELAERARARQTELDPGLLDTVAAAQAAAGRFDEAVATAEEASSVARQLGDESLAARLEDRLASYRAGRPWVDPASVRPGAVR